MFVDIIDNLEALDEVRENWNAALQDDPHTNIYQSFAWLRTCAKFTKARLQVLALRQGARGGYVAFLPLVLNQIRHGAFVERELMMLGSPMADYTGLVCFRAYNAAAIEEFSKYLSRHLVWDRMVATGIRDERINTLMSSFKREHFAVESRETVCPYVQLPTSWDEFFAKGITTDFRRNLKRRLRQVECLPNLRTIDVKADNLDSQVKTIIALNEARFGKRGRQDLFAAIYRACFDEGYLYLRTMWDGKVPIAATVGFNDRSRGTFYLYSSGFDDLYGHISPGTVLTAWTIRHAIEQGYRIFDFGRGPQRYKYSFGAKDRFSRRWVITRRGLRGSLIRAAHQSASMARAFWGKRRTTNG
jgi:CelD/BcsL family acetyltransferase involved in cellulose biosynthesis